MALAFSHYFPDIEVENLFALPDLFSKKEIVFFYKFVTAIVNNSC